MIKVFESVGEPANLFDDQVDGLGAAVADAVGVEVGQDLCFPCAEGTAQPGDFGDRAAVEAVEHLDRDLAALRRGGVVDGAQLLITLPGDVHLVCGVAGVEACSDLGLLTLGEVFHAVAEEPADLVQRVVFAAAVAQRVLLHAPPHLVDHLRPEPDDMERIEDSHGVRQAVTDGVGVAAERIQGGLFHAVDEAVGLGFQPALVDAAGAADDGVEQPGVQASGLVTGQINHDGDGPINPDPRLAASWVGPGRGGGIAAAPFPRTARRTRRATFTATGSPRKAAAARRVWLMVSTGSGSGSRGSGTG